MNVKYITCSDPREFNDIHDIVALGKMSPRTEIAIQMHPSKASPGMPRYEWTTELVRLAKSCHLHNLIMGKRPMPAPIKLAVHINNEWAAQICKTGRIPNELHKVLSVRYDGFNMNPVIGRIQINVPQSALDDASIIDMARMIDANRDYKFIIQYNEKTESLFHRLNRDVVAGKQISPLYDASGGRGISPDMWREPVLNSGLQGYSGGISPENVANNLTKISTVVPANRDIWIDAEGKLKTDNKFDVARARQYIENAENWIAQNNKQR